MIPRLTHQTWSSTDPPQALGRLREGLMALHPAWRHRLYSDQECRALVAEAAPALLPLYDAYPLPVQRFDLWRVVAVYAQGGFYLDLDIVVKAPLDDLCSLACVLAEEKTMDAASLKRHGHRPGDGLRIANYMFGARPGHPFFAKVLDEMERAVRPVRCDDDVLESTGPGLVTRVFHDFAGTAPSRDMTVLRNPGIRCSSCGGASCQFGHYATHLHMGSWRFGSPPLRPS